MMKKIILCIFALLILPFSAFAMFGCSTKEDIEPGATVVKVWLRSFEDWNSTHFRKVLNEINSDFTDGVHIKYELIEETAFPDKLAAAQQNGTAPDIYQISYQNLFAEYNNGTIKELNDLLPQSAFDDVKDSVMDLVEYGGKVLGYPQLVEASSVFYYNKDYLAAAGITKDPATWSFEDLYTACDALIDKGVTTSKQGKYPLAGFTADQRSWSTMGLQYGLNNNQEPINENWDKANVKTDGYKEYLKYFAQLFKDGGKRVGGDDTPYNDHIDELCREKVALCISGSWAIAEIMQTYPEMVDKIGVAPIPTLTGKKDVTTATNGGWSFVVDANSTNNDAVAKVLGYLASGDTAADKERIYSFFESAHFSKVIPRESIQELADTRVKGNVPTEWIETCEDISKYAIGESSFSFGIKSEIANIIDKVKENADNSKINTLIDEYLTSCEKAINDIIKNDSLAGKNPKKG